MTPLLLPELYSFSTFLVIVAFPNKIIDLLIFWS